MTGQVISHSSGQGLWVHFDKQSRPTLQYLQTMNSQDIERLSRSHSRYPTSLPVRLLADDATAEVEHARVIDLSRGGAFITGCEAPMIGTRVRIDMGPNAAAVEKRFQIEGRVAWVGNMDDLVGFGVRFDRRGPNAVSPLRTALRKASESGELSL